jgi:hypothetical protein
LPLQAQERPGFKTKINNLLLTITAPSAFTEGNKKVFVDKKKWYRVQLEYGDLKVEANRAAYDTQKKVIELADGFRGTLDQYQIEGNYFRVNPATGAYAGYDLKFGYLGAYLYGREYSFQKNKIIVDKMTVSPLQYPIFRLYTDRLEINPGYTLASRNTLKLFVVPVYYIPLYIDEGRRCYFDLPFPAFDAKSDIFHGVHASIHTHYFLNPSFYGDLALKQSERDGVGGQIQQVVRLNDHHQFELKVRGWEKADAQGNFSYEFQIFDNPRKPDAKLTFRQQQEQEKKIAGIPPNLVFRSDYTVNEEIQRSVVERYPDASLTGYLKGILAEHTYTIMPSLHYGKIKEKRIYPEGGTMQDVDRDYTRTRGELNFTYYLETPQLRPFIQKVLLGMDYERSVYDPGSTERSRLSSSLIVRRPILKTLGLYYEATLTKTLMDNGVSPFYFEEYGRLMDSATLDMYLQLAAVIGGNQLVYDLTNWQAYNEIYYLGVKAGNNYATLQYNRRLQSWEFAFMRKEAAF